MMRFTTRHLLQSSRPGQLLTGESPLNLIGLMRADSLERAERRRVLLLRSQKRRIRNGAVLAIERMNEVYEDERVEYIEGRKRKDDDIIARYPDTTPEGLLRGMDYVGTMCFASTGCISAGLAGMDVMGCTLVGTITATGGGTVRDLLLGSTPVFWFQEPEYLYFAVGTAFATFWAWHMYGEGVEKTLMTESAVFWVDSLGLGAFACIGVQNAVRLGLGFLPSVVCGLMTATFGGVIRDTLCRRPARILHANDETYAAAPLASSVAYLAARKAGATLAQKLVCGVMVSLAIRTYAVMHDYKLPCIGYVRERNMGSRTA